MAFKLIWSPSAQLDLKDIAAFIAEDSPSAAHQFVKSLFEVVERLADFPESGRPGALFRSSMIRVFEKSFEGHAGLSKSIGASVSLR